MTQQLMWHLSKRPEIESVVYINSDLHISSVILDFQSHIKNQILRSFLLDSFLGKVEIFDEKISAFTPFHYIPFSRRYKFLEELDLKMFKTKVQNILKKRTFEDVILFVNRLLPPKVLDIFSESKLRCFYISDNWSEFVIGSGRPDEIKQEAKESAEKHIEHITKNSDIVFCLNEHLTEKAKRLVPASYFLPMATDYSNFSKVCLDETPLAERMKDIRKPVIGCMGVISSSLDYDLLIHAARSRPDWSFVFIGPKLPASAWGEGLFKHKNVHHIGLIEYHQLPKYMKGFDVCIIPYSNHPSIQFADSNKVYDYLGTGKPIIAAYNTAGLDKFKEYIRISGTREKFIEDIEAALGEEQTMEVVQRRQRVAKEHSWERRAEFVWEKMSQMLK